MTVDHRPLTVEHAARAGRADRVLGLLHPVLAPGLAVAAAIAATHLLVLAWGESPARVLAAMLGGTWGSAYGIGQVLFKSTPLILTGLAVALPFRAGLFNVGAEGQATLGALATALVGLSLPDAMPAVLAVPAAALAGALAGGAWAAFPGWLRARFGAHEVITTILLNFVGLSLANWLLVSRFAVPESLHTAPVIEAARLSRLGDWVPAMHGTAASGAVLVAVALAAAATWLLFRTRTGYEMRVTGLSPRAAAYAGIQGTRVAVLALALGGACAGLAGLNFVQGYKGYFEDGFAGGVGYMGIAVAILARNHPLAIVPAALLFGTLSQGGLAINALVPKEIVDVLQAVVILVVLAVQGGLPGRGEAR